MEEQIKNFIKNEQFGNLAKYMFYEVHLCANGKNYRLMEIEFYVCNDQHKDIFTHCHSMQKKMLEWYFHRTSEKEHSYKGGTFKGLDVSCGFDGGHHGILIRSIMNENNGDVIEGPCNVVNALLKDCECDSVKNLVTEKMNDKLSCLNNKVIKLELKHYDGEQVIYKAPRIGLTLKGNNAEEKKKYIDRNYRFVLDKDKVKKEKKKFIML